MINVTQGFFKGKGIWLPQSRNASCWFTPSQQTCVNSACLACVSALRGPVVGMEVSFLGPWGARFWPGSLPSPVGHCQELLFDAQQRLSLAARCLSGGVCLGALPAGGKRGGELPAGQAAG